MSVRRHDPLVFRGIVALIYRLRALALDPFPDLFATEGPQDVVPIAHFSKLRSTSCRAPERDLDTLVTAYPASFRLVQHELPISGPPSELAARASVAAARQGKPQGLRYRFMQTPLVAEEASAEDKTSMPIPVC